MSYLAKFKYSIIIFSAFCLCAFLTSSPKFSNSMFEISKNIFPSDTKSGFENTKIKIFREKTRSISSVSMEVEDWHFLISEVARQQPKLIFLFHDFSSKTWQDFALKENLQQANLIAILPRDELKNNALPHDFANSSSRKDFPKSAKYIPKGDRGFFELPPETTSSIRYWGHSEFNRNNKLRPFISVHDDVIPHISLFISKELSWGRDRIQLNGQEIELDKNGYILAQSPWADFEFVSRHNDLVKVFEKAVEGSLDGEFSKDDIVVLIPERNPIDHSVQNKILASLMGIENTSWLREIRFSWSLMLIIGLTVAILFHVGSSLMAGFCSLLLGGVCFFIGKLTMEAGYLVDWISPGLVSFFIGSTLIFTLYAFSRRKQGQLDALLRNKLSDNNQTHMFKRYLSGDFEACEQIVTQVRISFMSFNDSNVLIDLQSLDEDQEKAIQIIIDQLKERNALVFREPHMIVGIFGSSFSEDSQKHPAAGLRAAEYIMRECFHKFLSCSTTQCHPDHFPLKIGIHTGPIDLGLQESKNGLKFNFHGKAISLSKHILQNTEPFRIALTESTYRALQASDIELFDAFKRKVPTGRGEDMIMTRDYNIFANKPEEYSKVKMFINKLSSKQRTEDRYFIKSDQALYFESDKIRGRIINISKEGFMIQSESFLGKTAVTHGFFKSEDGILERELADLGIPKIDCEIRWGEVSENKSFLHGAFFTNLELTQKEILFSRLKQNADRVDYANAI